MKTIRKACVQAVFDEFETQGELVHPFKDGDVEAMRALGHIVGYVDLDVTGLVDLIVDTINKEPAPPKSGRHDPHNVLLASSGFYVRVDVDGSARLIDGIHEITLAEFTAEESKDIIHTLGMIGGTR